jgi:sugar-phosphatase
MDGVLIDSEPLWRRAEIAVFGELGVSLTEEDCLETQGLRIDEVVDYWLERRPWQGRSREEVAHAIVFRVGALIRGGAVPLPGAEEALASARARGWRLALASSSPRRLIETVIDRFSRPPRRVG